MNNPTRRMLAGAGLALALLLAPAWARQARAITKISNVRVSTTEAGGAADVSGSVPTDATSAWALFDYVDANKTKIKVVVFNNGGEALLDLEPQKYTGAGTAKVELKADDIVHGAASLAEVYADNILDLAGMGADTRRVDGEIVDARTSLERDLRALGRVLVPMDRAGLTGAALDAKQTIDRLFPDVQEAVGDFGRIPVTDIAAMRARLEQLEPTATDLAAAAGDLDAEVAKLSSFTMAALYADNAAFTVAVKVDELGVPSTTAGSADFTVVQASKNPNPGAAAGSTSPTATPRLPATFSGIGDGAGTRPNTPVPTSASASVGTAEPGRSTAVVESGRSTAAAPTVTQPAGAVALMNAKSATSVAMGTRAPADDPGAPQGAGEPAGGSQGQSGAIGQPYAGGASAGGAGAPGSVPLPTFTVPADGGSTGAAKGGSAPSGGGGPNLLVLGAGIAVLIGLALWFRRRL